MKNILLNTVVLLASGSLAHAGPMLTSFIEPGTGTIYRSGSSLVGTQFGVESIHSGQTPLHSHENVRLFNTVGAHGFLLGDAHVNFSTGALLSEHTYGSLEILRFAQGGSFSLVGGANLDRLPGFHAGDVAGGTTLISGHFTSQVTLDYDRHTGLGTLFGSIRESLNPALASYYGISSLPSFLEVSFKASPDPDDKKGLLPDRDDVRGLGGVLTTLHTVPEPGFVALLTSGGLLGGLYSLCRRRTANN